MEFSSASLGPICRTMRFLLICGNRGQMCPVPVSLGAQPKAGTSRPAQELKLVGEYLPVGIALA